MLLYCQAELVEAHPVTATHLFCVTFDKLRLTCSYAFNQKPKTK